MSTKGITEGLVQKGLAGASRTLDEEESSIATEGGAHDGIIHLTLLLIEVGKVCIQQLPLLLLIEDVHVKEGVTRSLHPILHLRRGHVRKLGEGEANLLKVAIDEMEAIVIGLGFSGVGDVSMSTQVVLEVVTDVLHELLP